MPQNRTARPAFWSMLLLSAAALAAYSQTRAVPFVFDDLYSIVNNASLRHATTALRPPLESTTAGRPILNASLALNYALSGTAVGSYHAANLLIHVLAGLTWFGLVRRTLARIAPATADAVAFSAALLWLLHPLQTEAVTYVVQRAESLMGLFYLLTLYAFSRAADQSGRGRTGWATVAVASCFLGMGTKEVMASAPLVALLYDRTFLAGSFAEAWRRRGRLHAALASSWLLLLGLVLSSQGRNQTAGFGGPVSGTGYALTQITAIAHYLRLCFWPAPLVFDYGTALTPFSLRLIPAALLIAGLAAATAWALVRRPAWGFLGAAFFLILAPSSSLVPVATQTLAEHRMYLPLAAVVLLTVLGLHRWLGRAALPLGVVLGGILFALTWQRNRDYQSAERLWTDTVAKNPGNPRAHNALGNVWLKAPGRLTDAVAEYREAVRLQPENAILHNDLGYSLTRISARSAEGIAEFTAALRLDPAYAEAHYNLGNAWARTPGRMADAITEYEAALRAKPDYAEAHNNLGSAWLDSPARLDDALAQFREAIRLKPEYAAAHFNLAISLADLPGRRAETEAELQTVERLQPENAAARQLLEQIQAAR